MNQLKLLQDVALVITNVKEDKDILRQLSKLSYDLKSIESAEKLYHQFRELIMQQEDAHLAAKEMTRTLQDTRQLIQQKYQKHLSLTRLIFAEDKKAFEELGLKGKRMQRMDKWLKQCQRFYYHAGAYVALFEKYNIPSSEIEEMQTLLEQVHQIYAKQKAAQSQAQVLTQKKMEVGAALEKWYRKFIKVARIALEEQPQQLEALGVVVKG